MNVILSPERSEGTRSVVKNPKRCFAEFTLERSEGLNMTLDVFTQEV